MKNFGFIIILLIASYFNKGNAQKSTINLDIGYGYAFRQSASGYVVDLQYLRALSQRLKTGVLIGHYYNESRGLLPDDLSSVVIPFRDYTNPLTLGGYNGAWNTNSFPGVRLESKPNRYFSFVIGALFQYKLLKMKKNSMLIDISGAYAIRDEMGIARLLKADQIRFVNTQTFENAYIPIYKYSTYSDWMLRAGLSYSYEINSNMALRTRCGFTQFSEKGESIISGSFGIETRF